MVVTQRMRWIADRAASIAVAASIVFAGYVSYDRWLKPVPPVIEPPEELPLEPLSVEGALTFGSPKAPVGLIAYTDFLCPACGKFATMTMPRLRAEYVETGKVLLAVRFVSNGKTRPLAYKVAQAGQCAAAQQRYWPVHDELYKRGPVLSDDHLPMARMEQLLLEVARGAGLAEDAFRACLASTRVRDDVFEDAGTAIFLGVRNTPSFLMGPLHEGRLIDVTTREHGALTPEALNPLLDVLISRSSAVAMKTAMNKGE